jgi:hypothetical protein
MEDKDNWFGQLYDSQLLKKHYKQQLILYTIKLLLKHRVAALHTSTQLLSFMQCKTDIPLTVCACVYKQGIAQSLLVHKPQTGHQTKAFPVNGKPDSSIYHILVN